MKRSSAYGLLKTCSVVMARIFAADISQSEISHIPAPSTDGLKLVDVHLGKINGCRGSNILFWVLESELGLV